MKDTRFKLDDWLAQCYISVFADLRELYEQPELVRYKNSCVGQLVRVRDRSCQQDELCRARWPHPTAGGPVDQ
uniref:Uncharacterized protein n=1 Tax=Rhodnius prolixus TaxID=13249 RepID=T1HZF8_RHOPR